MALARALLCYVTAAAGAACNALRTRSASARARALLTLRCDGNCSEGETVHGKTNRAKFAIRPK